MMTSYFRMIKVLVAQDEYHQGTSCDLELQDNCILYFTRIYWLYLLHVTSTPAKLDWYSQIGIYRIINKHKRSLIHSRQTTTICSQPSLSSLKRQYSRSHCTTAECFSPHHEPWSNLKRCQTAVLEETQPQNHRHADPRGTDLITGALRVW